MDPQLIAVIGLVGQAATLIFLAATWKAKRESNEGDLAGKFDAVVKLMDKRHEEHKGDIYELRKRDHDLANAMHVHSAKIAVIENRVGHLEHHK